MGEQPDYEWKNWERKNYWPTGKLKSARDLEELGEKNYCYTGKQHHSSWRGMGGFGDLEELGEKKYCYTGKQHAFLLKRNGWQPAYEWKNLPMRRLYAVRGNLGVRILISFTITLWYYIPTFWELLFERDTFLRNTSYLKQGRKRP